MNIIISDLSPLFCFHFSNEKIQPKIPIELVIFIINKNQKKSNDKIFQKNKK